MFCFRFAPQSVPHCAYNAMPFDGSVNVSSFHLSKNYDNNKAVYCYTFLYKSSA